MPHANYLQPVPPSPWLKKAINGIEYWVYILTGLCGIHIRGLALLCGVHENAIRSAIQNAQKHLQKVGSEVRKNYKTELSELLKDKVIFLEEVRKNSPIQQGGPSKVIVLEVCMIFIRYYAKKGKPQAIETLSLFSEFGAEQFIYIQTGYIARPESVVLGEIEYLIAKETVQVNKSRQKEVQYFTNPKTGECGIDLQSLGFLCGGVALKHIETFLAAQNEPFLQPQHHSKQIVKAPICAKVLQHFGHEHKPRKTVAQHWAKDLEPIVPTLHKKTNYQAPAVTDRETQLAQQIDTLQEEVTRLKQLVKEDETQGLKKRHRLMGRVLQWAIPKNLYDVRLEEETSHIAQLLDSLILKRLPQQSLPKDVILPDGLTLDAEISLLTYKSPLESLNLWTIQELIGHYVGYRKILAAQHPKHTLPDAKQFALYAVTTMFPQELVKQVGPTAWQSTTKSGVYQLCGFGLEITVIVINEITTAPHNRPWNLLSSQQTTVDYALNQDVPLPDDLKRYFERNS
ncbi:hypothetical protein TI03_02480 [Achromatium sp. WMS1]|nr:hypothetical protein TI03_02480 [Achromatium sp. WMS1]